MAMTGPVRFRYRNQEEDIDILIQGDADWVEKIRDELGISGNGPGFLSPVFGSVGPRPSSRSSKGPSKRSNEEQESISIRPGPEPDPSKIPASIREIGALDIHRDFEEMSITSTSDLDFDEIQGQIDAMGPFEPLEDAGTERALEEKVLQSFMGFLVQVHGMTAIPEKMLHAHLGNRFDMGVEEFGKWLRRLWRVGRLERMFGSDGSDSYVPFPYWLERE
ncbi:MAG TPA: hypothetical protein HA330_06535 [Candidatus Thalassarchaeaceae archaeon]|nr:MAG TPA: hypothetical protein D7H85_06535 [Candidatus Poseidoniales archaeon]HII49530.1 hypothetical protein [Candidatus Thalassarchaeaceae archaeon]